MPAEPRPAGLATAPPLEPAHEQAVAVRPQPPKAPTDVAELEQLVLAPAAQKAKPTFEAEAAAARAERREGAARGILARRLGLSLAVVLALGAAVLLIVHEPVLALLVAVVAATTLERDRQAVRATPLTWPIHRAPGGRSSIGPWASGLPCWPWRWGPPPGCCSAAPWTSVSMTPRSRLRADRRPPAARFASPPSPAGPTPLSVPSSWRAQSSAFTSTHKRRGLPRFRSQPAGRGMRWLFIAVDGTNLHRSHFDPNTLACRLRDQEGNVYYADIAGGTGPPSRSTPGLLRRGLTAQARLGFRVPNARRRLALVFEPVTGGSLQVRVPIPPG